MPKFRGNRSRVGAGGTTAATAAPACMDKVKLTPCPQGHSRRTGWRLFLLLHGDSVKRRDGGGRVSDRGSHRGTVAVAANLGAARQERPLGAGGRERIANARPRVTAGAARSRLLRRRYYFSCAQRFGEVPPPQRGGRDKRTTPLKRLPPQGGIVTHPRAQ